MTSSQSQLQFNILDHWSRRCDRKPLATAHAAAGRKHGEICQLQHSSSGVLACCDAYKRMMISLVPVRVACTDGPIGRCARRNSRSRPRLRCTSQPAHCSATQVTPRNDDTIRFTTRLSYPLRAPLRSMHTCADIATVLLQPPPLQPAPRHTHAGKRKHSDTNNSSSSAGHGRTGSDDSCSSMSDHPNALLTLQADSGGVVVSALASSAAPVEHWESHEHQRHCKHRRTETSSPLELDLHASPRHMSPPRSPVGVGGGGHRAAALASLSPSSTLSTASAASSLPSTPPRSPHPSILASSPALDANSSASASGSGSSAPHSSVSSPQISESMLPPVVVAPGSLIGMRGRFIKMMSMPLALQLPNEEGLVSDAAASGALELGPAEAGLRGLIVPLASVNSGAAAVPVALRSASLISPTIRSLTPPPLASSPSSHSASLLHPFTFASPGVSRNGSLSRVGGVGGLGGMPLASPSSQDGVQISGPSFGASAHQGCRPSMQDSFTCKPESKIYAVCDGHGRSGHIVAALATAMMPTLVAQAIAAQTTAGVPSVPAAMRTAFAQLDAHLLKHTTQGGSTALLAHIAPPAHAHNPDAPDAAASLNAAPEALALYLAHVGDTRAVLSSLRKARALTEDHKPELPAERAQIVARGGSVVLQSRGGAAGKKQAMEQAMAAASAAALQWPATASSTGAPSTPPQQPRARQDGFNPFSAAFTEAASSAAAAPAASPVATAAASSSVSSAAAVPVPPAAASWRVEGQLNVSRSLGDGHLKHCIDAVPSICVHPLASQDEFVILATDGLWGSVGEQEAVDAVHAVMDAARVEESAARAAGVPLPRHIHSVCARAADQLATLALQKGSQDNVCVVVVMLQQHA